MEHWSGVAIGLEHWSVQRSFLPRKKCQIYSECIITKLMIPCRSFIETVGTVLFVLVITAQEVSIA